MQRVWARRGSSVCGAFIVLLAGRLLRTQRSQIIIDTFDQLRLFHGGSLLPREAEIMQPILPVARAHISRADSVEIGRFVFLLGGAQTLQQMLDTLLIVLLVDQNAPGVELRL